MQNATDVVSVATALEWLRTGDDPDLPAVQAEVGAYVERAVDWVQGWTRRFILDQSYRVPVLLDAYGAKVGCVLCHDVRDTTWPVRVTGADLAQRTVNLTAVAAGAGWLLDVAPLALEGDELAVDVQIPVGMAAAPGALVQGTLAVLARFWDGHTTIRSDAALAAILRPVQWMGPLPRWEGVIR